MFKQSMKRKLGILLSIVMSMNGLSVFAVHNESYEPGYTLEEIGTVTSTTSGALVTTPPSMEIKGRRGSLLSQGCSYQVSHEAHENYPDEGSQLTNGFYAQPDMMDGEWVGFYTPGTQETIEVIVDLGERKSITSIGGRFLKDGFSGISLPGIVEAAVSDDGSRWKSLKKELIEEIEEPVTAVTYEWNGLSDTIPWSQDAQKNMVYTRYVKLSFQVFYWSFIDEIEIYGFEGKHEEAIGIDEEGNHNLAEGLSYTASEPASSSYPDSGGELTDGSYGAESLFDPAWQGHSGGEPIRTIEIDLGEGCSFSEVKAGFLFDAESSVKLPTKFEILVSQDGEKWATVPNYMIIDSPEKNTQITRLAWKAKDYMIPQEGQETVEVYGRYVKVVVGVSIWCFMDEIEIMGVKGMSEGAVILEPDQPMEKGYLKSGEHTDFIKHLLLAYNGHYENKLGEWTKEDFIPYVAYVDEQGQPIDNFFDGVLFLGLRTPEGRMFMGTNNISQAAYKEDWEWYLDKTLKASGDMNALNEATKQIAQELDQPDLKTKVVMMIPYPDPIQLDFGDVDGDGLSECLNPQIVGEEEAIQNQKKVVDWYLEEFFKRWSEKSYTHLELSGFYWLEESTRKPQVIQYTAKQMKEMNLKFFWIPYFHSEGYTQWKKFGFDATVFQPNHTFNGTSKDQIKKAADIAIEYNMGVELELDAGAIRGDLDIYNRYFDYLDGGADYGFMGDDAFKAYYQDVKAYRDAAYSKEPKLRYIYDATYQFTKGTYQKGYVQYLTLEKVKYTDLLDVKAALDEINKYLGKENLSEEERAYLEQEKAKVTLLLEKINEVKTLLDEILTSCKGLTPENVTPSHEIYLSELLEDTKQLLEGQNLAERQKNDLIKKQEKILELWKVLDDIAKVRRAIEDLPAPEEVKRADKQVIYEALNLYQNLNNYQLTFIEDSLKDKLEQVKRAYDRLKDNSEIVPPQGGGGGQATLPEQEKIPFYKQLDWSHLQKGEISTFVDVEEAVYEKSIKKLLDLGIMKGRTPQFFEPEGNLTRGEMAVIFNRILAGDKKAESGFFKDIRGNEWYAEAIYWMSAEGLVEGYENGEFRPKQWVTREEVGLISERINPEVKLEWSQSIDSFKQPITRGEMCWILCQLLELNNEE